jgi:dethiobiotin synthetase
MRGFFVTGIGTEVGKTIVSTLLVKALQGDYWKPISALAPGDESDGEFVARYNPHALIHPERFRFHAPQSPHVGATMEGIDITLEDFILPPLQKQFFIVEGAGGVFVPLNLHRKLCILDLIKYLSLPVIIVSRFYLGSINHTLLTLKALEGFGISISGVIFNGEVRESTVEAILSLGGVKNFFTLPEIKMPLTSLDVERFANTLREKISSW